VDEIPFPHHGPLAPGRVSGRDVEVGDLALRLNDRRPTALLAPRRFGKTTLVRQTLWQMDQVVPNAAVSVDLFGVTSFADFAVRLDRALVEVRGRFREVLDSVAGGLSVRLGLLDVELRRTSRPESDPVVACHRLLDVLTGAAARSPVVLALDEFSDVVNVEGLDALLRTHLQHHYQTIGLVFAGSRPSMMRDLFTHGGRPFFSQADLVELGPLSQSAVSEIVHGGFRATERAAGPVALRVIALGAGHPQRTMQLADAAWRRTAVGIEATEEIWAAAVAEVRASLDGPFAALYEELPSSQGPVLRAVARTGSPFSATEARFHDLAKSSISAARDGLLRDGHLARTDNGVAIVDPLFADWLLRIFP
jgi:hypothetical protein